MTRIARDPRGARLADPRLIGLGVLFGLAALTRNEALWLGAGLGDRGLAGRRPPTMRAARSASSASPASSPSGLRPVAGRDWVVFGSPLPGQAATNAFS